MVTITLTKSVDYDAKLLYVDCEPRYWEDARLNGKEDADGNMPGRVGDSLRFTIDLDTGQILNWPKGVTASMNYKVCDAGNYKLTTEGGENIIMERDGYVPNCLCIGENGFGDYFGLQINEEGYIKDWHFDVYEWEDYYEDYMC